MQPFFEWFARTVNPSEPWLILGKGPSFALRDRFDLSGYCTLSLNHVVREQPVLVAHVIDVDVIEACGSALERNARFLVMPWYPHVGNRVGARSLAELIQQIPLLRRLDDEGRLLWYDLSTSPVRHGPHPMVEATYFSAEAALNLLALAGVRRVRSLGCDGGAAYSGAFEDLRDSTLLANGRANFDLQFEGFARTIVRTGLDFAPLDRRTPARVYIAHGPEEALQARVLEHSVRRRASLTVEVVATTPGGRNQVDDGDGVVVTARAQVLIDLRPLWRSEVGDNELVIPRDSEDEPRLILAGPGPGHRMPILASQVLNRASAHVIGRAVPAALRAGLGPQWNPGWTGSSEKPGPILLFRADGSEPWLSRGHVLGHLWMRDLLDGLSLGSISADFVAEEVRRGHVRPSLLYQIDHCLEEPLLLPGRARRLDRAFQPAQRGTGNGLAARPRWSSIVQAMGRQVARRGRALFRRPNHSRRRSNGGLVIPP